MRRIALVGLVKIELPGAVTARISDGGVVRWGSETYASRDPLLGAIGALQGLSEGAGEQVPELRLTLLLPGSTPVSSVAQPGWQQSRVRLWLGEYDPALGTLIGDPDLLFDGVIDQSVFVIGRTRRELEMSIVSTAERLFERNMGSALSPVFHKSVWPGETGNDNATGLARQIAWGIEAPPAATSSGVGVGGGTGFAGRQQSR